MIFRKFAYADDLALLHSSGNWKDLEGTLSQDMSTLSLHLQTWRLKLSHTKTVTTALGKVEMGCQFPEGLILGRFFRGQSFFSFFVPAVHCAVTYGQHS